MYSFLKNMHSGWAYLVLVSIVGALVFGLINYLRGKEYHNGIQKSAMVAFVLTHIQLLFGILVYLVSPVGLSNFSGEAMGNALSRLYILEHPLTMFIAIIFITLGYTRSKKAEGSAAKYKKLFIFYSLGLILMLLRIPWNAWPGN